MALGIVMKNVYCEVQGRLFYNNTLEHFCIMSFPFFVFLFIFHLIAIQRIFLFGGKTSIYVNLLLILLSKI